jgi:type IX secretion system PorP/SprF family membrane protein
MRKLLYTLIFLLLVGALRAQEIHFSQFWANPLLLNPAFSGNSGCSLFAGLDYRSQDGSIGVPYVTESAIVDGRLRPAFIGYGWFGLGATFYADKAGDGALKTTHAMGYFAYTMGFNKRETVFATVGVGVGRVWKSLNTDALTSPSQAANIINNLPPGPFSIDITNSSLSYTDFNAGVLVNFLVNRGPRFIVGASLQHVNTPVVSFFSNNANRLDWKMVFHAQAEYTLEDKFILRPGIMASTMASTKEIIAGSNLLYGFYDVQLIGGLWVRVAGDIIPMAGLEYKGLTFIASYDANISPLHKATHMAGGYEFSLIKTFNCGTEKRRRFEPCRNLEFSLLNHLQ